MSTDPGDRAAKPQWQELESAGDTVYTVKSTVQRRTTGLSFLLSQIIQNSLLRSSATHSGQVFPLQCSQSNPLQTYP